MNITPRKPLSYYKFGKHKKDARRRGIDVNMTLGEWYNWFLQHGVDKNLPSKLSKDTLCMCRINDNGPYELGNIYCATLSQNQKDARKFNPNFGKTRSKPFKTPVGIFQSKKDAYTALGVTDRQLNRLMGQQPSNYHWL